MPYTYTTLNDPLATNGTQAKDINVIDQVVGGYSDASGTHGFLFSGGTYVTLNDPLATNGTFAYGLNASGQIVGSYADASGTHGYLFSGGTYVTLNDPLATAGTIAYGINAAGQIVGQYFDGTGEHGFLYSGGTYTTLDAPSASTTIAIRINAAGQIVGDYSDNNGGHGFLYSGGIFTPLNDPLATLTDANGINDSGDVVGIYVGSTQDSGFVLSGGTYTALDVPLSTFTNANDISAAGQIVGDYTDGGGYHGFLATPTSTVIIKSGAEFLVNTTTLNAQIAPAITALPDGQFVVAWTDFSQTDGDTSGLAVRAQIFNADGSKSGAEFLVNTTTSGDEQRPAVTSLSDGRFVVAWQDSSQSDGDTSGLAVRAQIFNADGSKSGTEFLVNTTTVGDQSEPTITALAGGRFVASWIDTSQTGSDTSSWAIRAQIFNSDGNKSGAEFLVNTTTAGIQFSPVVHELTDGRFVEAWTDGSQSGGDTSGYAVRAQIFNADGSKSGGELLVNTTTLGNQGVPTIAPFASGGFVAAWEDSSHTGGNTGVAIRAQIFNVDGSKSGAEFLVNTTTAGDEQIPNVSVLTDGRFVVSWQDSSQTGGDTSGHSIRAQVFYADGSKYGTEYLVNTTTAGDQFTPVIAPLLGGNFATAWWDNSQTGGDTSSSAIRAQIFNPGHGAILDALSIDQQIELIYIGYFNRSGDQGGFNFWEAQDAFAQAHGQSANVALTNIANSFAPQPETAALYPTLVSNLANFHPLSVQTQMDMVSFVSAAYQNLFGHGADGIYVVGNGSALGTGTGGLFYWVNQLLTGQVGLGASILAIANGARGSDTIILQNKITVALDFTNLTSQANIPTSSALLAEAKAVLTGVDGISLNDASVTAAEALIAPWIASHPHGASIALVGSTTAATHPELV